MKLKPKSTVKNPKALLYKRFIGLEKSLSLDVVYHTVFDGEFWVFDNETLKFTKLTNEEYIGASTEIDVEDFVTIFQYKGLYFRYTGTEWQTITNLQDENITLLNSTFNNIANYQTNKYYYVGSFDYVIRGSIEGTTTQYIKGNIIPLSSLNITHYNDDIDLSPDDLVVIDGRLYSVENPETSIKQQPKPYKIYFATLNSVL